jgi:hypothetical protein
MLLISVLQEEKGLQQANKYGIKELKNERWN